MSTLLAVLLSLSVTHAENQKKALLQWDFEADTGNLKREAGPRPTEYPGFDKTNTAAFFPGSKPFLVVKDHGKGGKTNLRFGSGDSITLEAWVKIKALGSGQQQYLIGKGRNLQHGEALGDTNQNFAMRLMGTGDGGQLGFLFSSTDPGKNGARNWHRWWSEDVVGLHGWHHVAIVYTFGKGDSLRAYIDGKETKGTWDMGGATDLPPVTDASDLVIGTGYSRGAGQSFSGWMDNLAIYRSAVPAEVLKKRFEYVPLPPPPPPVTKSMLPKGKVLVQLSEEGVPAANAWPERPKVTETYEEEVFGFFEIPQKYTSTGVRADRPIPTLMRAAALVEMPKGKHRLLLRGRGASKLIIDGKEILNTPFPKGDTGGHGYLSAQDEYLDLGPDFRFAPPGNRESWVEFESKGGEHFVILETFIGGVAGKSKRRPELGETVAAISPEGSESWKLLSPGERQVAYTDQGWSEYEEERREWLTQLNTLAREEKRNERSDYWAKRDAAAKQWLAKAKKVSVPELPQGYEANNGIDHFIAARIDEAAKESRAAAGGSVDYFKEVKPLLEGQCYDCHQGGKAKGDLRLDRHDWALKGGKSDGPAIVPGDTKKSSLLFRIGQDAGDDIMPPKGDPLSEKEIAVLNQWIEEGAHWPEFEVSDFEPGPLSADLAFLRRVTLDTVGVVPTEAEIAAFQSDSPETRRENVIKRLLDDPRWADHWMGYWQDVLAENPNVINPTLNNTGPFRWWIHESLVDNKRADLFVTELIRMEGSERFGGAAGFGTASQNDVPMAAKGIIVSSAFLGVEMKCARCHDAPSNVSLQEDLFSLAAMLKEDEIKVPTTSSVPMDKIHESGRKPLIEVTLAPGSVVKPGWPFDRYCDESVADKLARDPKDPRDRLATLITAPQNERFAQVMVNRIWERFMGRGIVKNLADWEKSEATHPELLRWLGHQLVESGYDMKVIASLILNSHAYQRAVDPTLTETGPLYISPAPRRLSAEQIVDSLFSATGKPFEVEEVSLDIDSVRALNTSLSLGKPTRAWMLASTSNERDRPSLSLPRIQAVSSVMETFGWRGARQDPVSQRDTDPNVLQPAILANGTMGTWLTRLSDDHGVTALALEDQPLDRLIDRLFLRLLTREATPSERERFVSLLEDGYGNRVIPEGERKVDPVPEKRVPVRFVSWSNHLDGAANTLAQEKEAEARRGDPPTRALNPEWRTRLEDVLWAMLNAPEWIYTP